MGDKSEALKTATSDLLKAVVAAAVAGQKADEARAAQAPNLFAVAQAHRAAEKRTHDLTDACIKAARAAWEAGEIHLGAPTVEPPAT